MFLLASTFAPRHPDAQTVPVAIAYFTGAVEYQIGTITAACVVVTIPMIIVALIFRSGSSQPDRRQRQGLITLGADPHQVGPGGVKAGSVSSGYALGLHDQPTLEIRHPLGSAVTA